MSCDGPLQGREGHAIFKYFLVSDRRRRAKQKPPGSVGRPVEDIRDART
jgi:hypothetical protein